MSDGVSLSGEGDAAAATATGPSEGPRQDLSVLTPRAYLEYVGTLADESIDLAQAALAFAALDYPDRSLSDELAHLQAIQAAAAASTSASASVDMQATALLDVMTETLGYRGDSETYEDMRNADLISVMERRRGLPVALGILYMHAVVGYGGHVDGLAFPAHFCVRLEARGQRLIIDPFEAVVLSARDLRSRLKERMHREAEIIPAYHQPVVARDILFRLQNNIRFRAVRSGDLDRARATIERMMLIAPGRVDLCRELALIHARRGDIVAATTVVEHFLAVRRPPSDSSGELEDLLKRLRAAAPGG